MNFFKRNFYAFIAIFLMVFSFFFLWQIQQLYKSDSNEIQLTSVGNIYIGNQKTEEGKREYIREEVSKWRETVSYVLEFQNVTYQIDKLQIDTQIIAEFDLDDTMDNIVENQKNDVSFNAVDEGKDLLEAALIEAYSNDFVEDLQFDALFSDIIQSANKLTRKKVFLLEKYLTSWSRVTVSSITLNGSGQPNSKLTGSTIDSIIALVNDISVSQKYYTLEDCDATITILPQFETPNSLGFSAISYFRSYYEEYRKTHTQQQVDLLGEQLDVIVTGLAAVIQESSFYVTVKNQSINEVDYAYKYMTARVKMGTTPTDFRFINPEKSTYYVGINKVSDSEINFRLVGCKYLRTYIMEYEPYIIELHKDPVLQYIQDLSQTLDDMLIDIEEGIYYYINTPEVPGKLITYYRLVLEEMRPNSVMYIDGDLVAHPDIYVDEFGVKFDVFTDAYGTKYEFIERDLIYKKQEYYEATAAIGQKKELTAGAIYSYGQNSEGGWTEDLIRLYGLMLDLSEAEILELIDFFLGGGE